MLPGENFGRGHQHGLEAVGHRQQHGVDRHHGFAAPHVALQEPVHRPRAGHVGGNLGDGLFLSRGELEGEQPADAGVDLGRGQERRRLSLVVLLLPPDGQGKLQDEQLLIHQSPPGAIQTLLVAGEMDLRQCLAERPEVVAAKIFFRKNLVELVGIRFHCPADDFPNLPLLQTFGQGIDGQDFRDRLFFLRVEHLHLRMVHLPDEPFVFRLAGEHHPLPEAELLAHEGLIEPDRAELSGAAADRHAQDAAAGERAAQVDVLDHAADRLEFALLKLVQLALADVLIIAGKEEQDVADGMQSEPFEQFGPRRPHALQILQGRGQELSGGGIDGRHSTILTRDRGERRGARRGERGRGGEVLCVAEGERAR